VGKAPLEIRRRVNVKKSVSDAAGIMGGGEIKVVNDEKTSREKFGKL